MKSVETDDSIRKTLESEDKFLVFESMLSNMLMWLVFYLDYFLLVNASLSITSAFIWLLPKFPGHFAPLLYLVGILSVCPAHSQFPHWPLLQSHWYQGYIDTVLAWAEGHFQ